MLIHHLSLTNFRNFIRLECELPEGPLILVGANGQGKTSLLEGLHFTTTADSPHASADRQLLNLLALREDPPFARCRAEISRGGRSHRLEIRLIATLTGTDLRVQKEIWIDGARARQRDLAGRFPTVLFLPQDLNIIEGSPSERRRFLDASLMQASPEYAEATGAYNRALAQRNSLLKQIQDARSDPDSLAEWDEALAEPGSLLIRERALALTELGTLAAGLHRQLTRGREALQLEYLPAPIPVPEGAGQIPLPWAAQAATRSGDDLRRGMLEGLQAARTEEIRRGLTLLGPHRDDIRFLSNGLELRLYGSRGQNRTAMLSAKLAQVDWLRSRTGEAPVLLLDEVLAELDAERREDLLSRVAVAPQTVLTSADAAMFPLPFRRQATVWEIVGGQVLAQPPT